MDDFSIQVLRLVKALYGAVSPNFRMVMLSSENGRWQLTFVLEREDAEDREEIYDVVDEFEALQEKGIGYDLHVLVSGELLVYPKVPAWVVYRRRE
ncbi:hypothetical protein QWZ03_15045 [Chitinimonas viridis]|uniref:DUF1902 domain-containing protein n=1 Tax=Chitinimonas viridis TaxID=664880 RepID=A0ABT8B954_9NEIS|nr:hypothetical protein [Chitinimonas viridis]MDN3578083.1 hypothetical protein [Chitinimonas viridis]